MAWRSLSRCLRSTSKVYNIFFLHTWKHMKTWKNQSLSALATEAPRCDGVSGNPMMILATMSKPITSRTAKISFLLWLIPTWTIAEMTGFLETPWFSPTSNSDTRCDWFLVAKCIWLRVTGFPKTPWFRAKCIWLPITPGQMHLATNHSRPNAFGHQPTPLRNKIPIRKELIMTRNNIARKFSFHLLPQPQPQARYVMQGSVLLFGQLA